MKRSKTVKPLQYDESQLEEFNPAKTVDEFLDSIGSPKLIFSKKPLGYRKRNLQADRSVAGSIKRLNTQKSLQSHSKVSAKSINLLDELSSCKLFSNSPMQKCLRDSHLRPAEYRQVITQTFLQLAHVKAILSEGNCQQLTEDKMVEFTFKKPGFKKLLIFDLDETLIHVKRSD